MPKCNNKVEQRVALKFGYMTLKSKCGDTGHDGDLILCPTCKIDLDKKYPQGWRSVPGDTCEHGNFIGDIFGLDHTCELCEGQNNFDVISESCPDHYIGKCVYKNVACIQQNCVSWYWKNLC